MTFCRRADQYFYSIIVLSGKLLKLNYCLFSFAKESFADDQGAVKDHVMSYVEGASRAPRGYVLSRQEVSIVDVA